MKMENIWRKWITSFTYLISILTSIYLFHAQFLDNLRVNLNDITIKRSPQLPLRFNSQDGTFKILQVADMHFGQGLLTRCRDVLPSEFKYCSDLNTTRFVQRLIEAEKPDFIAFTGDNIFGSSTPDAAESLFDVFRPAVESRLPWAAVLGNHDQESTLNREELMSLISLMDYSVSQVNPSSKDPTFGIDGFGNYNLQVHGPYGSALANVSVLNLLFLDSGDRVTVDGRRTYGWIRNSQLDWLQDVSKTEPLALGFFHIPIPEIKQLYYQKIVGQFQESVACSSVNSQVLKKLVEIKNVKAVFIGHDHTNDFCGNLDGIWFCYGGGSGYHGYGKVGWSRRARVIHAQLSKKESTWIGLDRLTTWKRLDDKMLSKIDKQLLWSHES